MSYELLFQNKKKVSDLKQLTLISSSLSSLASTAITIGILAPEKLSTHTLAGSPLLLNGSISTLNIEWQGRNSIANEGSGTAGCRMKM
jgi:hypothetical protein